MRIVFWFWVRKCVDLLDLQLFVFRTLFFRRFPDQFENAWLFFFLSSFNTIIYSRQTATNGSKQSQCICRANSTQKNGEKTHTPKRIVAERRHTRWMRFYIAIVATETESSSTFGVVAIVSDCFVCDRSFVWSVGRSVELLCIVTVCYIKWTMACMSPAPINTCDIWCETCISWFHFCVRCAGIFVCSFRIFIGHIRNRMNHNDGSLNCAQCASLVRSFNRAQCAHCQCQNIAFTIKQKDDCLCVCRLFYVIDENWQYFNGIQL